MIQNKTARALMYAWHCGSTCPLYAAASSGLVESWDNLLRAVNTIDNEVDKEKLTQWVKTKQRLSKFSVIVMGSSYSVLPWVSRTYG